MKNIMFLALLALCSCAPSEKYVHVVDKSVEKSAMIEVPTVVTRFTLTVTKNGLEVHQATVTARIIGSGVFISPQGHILTCAHLFNNGPFNKIQVTLSNGIKVNATLIYQDTQMDLALIKVPGTYPYVKLAPEDVKIGQEVILIGNPMGLQFTVSHGIVSSVKRDIGEGFTFTQTDGPINPGNSGGPMFNLSGELVGINARKLSDADGMGFAVSLSTIDNFLTLFRGLNQ